MPARFSALAAVAAMALTAVVSVPTTVAAAPAAKVVDPVAVALKHLRGEGDQFGLTSADASDLAVTDVVPTKHNNTTTVYVQQQVNGIGVEEAISAVTVKGDAVAHVGARTVTSAEQAANSARPQLSDIEAVVAAAKALKLKPTGSFATKAEPKGKDLVRELADGGISRSPIKAQLAYVDTGKFLRLAWQLTIEEKSGEHWWRISIDADNGKVLNKVDYVDHAFAEDPANVGGGNYNVFKQPVESPEHGSRTTVFDPATAPASPYGWHDTNGAAGAEFTVTRGNNVDAYTDTDANNIPDTGSRPDGGAGLNFNFPLDLSLAPYQYQPAAVTNLFYWNNYIHDITYKFGFDEAAGNFQVNNYGRGGTGADAVQAEAQDGSGTSNANFATPPDGQAPRMQMYVWTAPNPDRDGDLDNGIIVHEYGHGVSNRLTGGPSTTSCLNVDEQGGEGWSDWLALMLTMAPGYTTSTSRGVGSYATTNPNGIRQYRYSTDLSVNPMTYDSIKTVAVPHGVGTVWATMLWEVTAALIDKHGSDHDLSDPTSGNSRAMQLVLDGMKLQPCNPGFVDARDAILAADQAGGGNDRCLIWEAFAKRGLGASAIQGSSDSRLDGTEAFDMPENCSDLSVTTTASADPVTAGGTQTYTVKVKKESAGTGKNVKLVSTLSSNQAYVAGSSSCANATYAAATRKLTITLGSIGSGATRTCNFQATVASTPYTIERVADDFEGGLAKWDATHASGTTDWQIVDNSSSSPTHSAFAPNPANLSDQYLALASDVAISNGTVLEFRHRYALEAASATTGFDGGVVEISTDDGATWSDIGEDNFRQGGYTHTISSGFGNPLGGRKAFSGAAEWQTSRVDLNGWKGDRALIRFRLGSDTSVGATGWWIDDVRVARETWARVSNRVTGNSMDPVTEALSTLVVPAPKTKPGKPTSPTATPTSQSVTKVDFTEGSNGGLPITKWQATCTSSDGGTTRSKTGAAHPLSVTSLTKAKTYRCRARATNSKGTGPWSAWTPWFLQGVKPTSPRTVTATPTSSTKTTVDFTERSNGGLPVTSWQATCTSSDGGTGRSKTGATHPLTVSSLTAGKSYRCRARGTNAIGTSTWSAWSPQFVQAVLPTAPSNVVVTRASATSARANAKAANNGGSPVTKYTASCTSNNGGTSRSASKATKPVTITQLSTGKKYRCRMRATNAVGNGPWSAWSGYVTITP